MRMEFPCIGGATESVVHMQGEDLHAEFARRMRGGMQQRGRVATAAEGDGDDPRFDLRSPWCR
jgi:hypothetical protein